MVTVSRQLLAVSVALICAAAGAPRADESAPIVMDTIGDAVNDPVTIPIESGQFMKAGGCEPDGDCWPLVMSAAGVVQSDPVTIRAQLDRIEAMLCALKPPPPTCTPLPGESSCVTRPTYQSWRDDLPSEAFEGCP